MATSEKNEWTKHKPTQHKQKVTWLLGDWIANMQNTNDKSS